MLAAIARAASNHRRFARCLLPAGRCPEDGRSWAALASGSTRIHFGNLDSFIVLGVRICARGRRVASISRLELALPQVIAMFHFSLHFIFIIIVQPLNPLWGRGEGAHIGRGRSPSLGCVEGFGALLKGTSAALLLLPEHSVDSMENDAFWQKREVDLLMMNSDL